MVFTLFCSDLNVCSNILFFIIASIRKERTDNRCMSNASHSTPSHATGTRNELDLVPLACEDALDIVNLDELFAIFHSMERVYAIKNIKERAYLSLC